MYKVSYYLDGKRVEEDKYLSPYQIKNYLKKLRQNGAKNITHFDPYKTRLVY